MPKSKKKKGGETSDHLPSHIEESRSPEQEETDNEFLQKYTGENNQAMWFRNIIRAQYKQVMQETLAQEVQKVTINMELQLKKLQGKVEQLESDIFKKTRKIERLEFESTKKDLEIKAIKEQVDAFQQQKYSHCLQLVGMPESKDDNEDTKQIIKMSKDKLGIKLKPNDFEEVRRLGKRRELKTRNIVVKLKDKSLRDRIFDNRKKSITDPNPKNNTYINDRLTQHRQSLLYAARNLVKSKKLYAAWSQRGNILVRKGEESNIIEIKDHSDLRCPKNDEDAQEEHPDRTDQNSSNDSSRDRMSTLTHLSDYEYFVDSDV